MKHLKHFFVVVSLMLAIPSALHAAPAEKPKESEGGEESKAPASPGTHMVIILAPEEYWKNLAQFSYKTLRSLIGESVVFAMPLFDDASDPPEAEYKAVYSKIYKKGVGAFKNQEYPDAIGKLQEAAAGFDELIKKYGLSYTLRRRIALSYMYLGAAQLMDAQIDEAKTSFRQANAWFTNYPLPKSAFEEETPRNVFAQAIERPGRGAGTIVVNASVPGQLFLNGLWVGEAPQNLENISAGTHFVTWARLGYKPVTIKVNVPENDKAVADFNPAPDPNKKQMDAFLSALDEHLRQKVNVPPILADFAVRARVENIIVFRATANETEISWYNAKAGAWQKRVRRAASVPGTLATQVENFLFIPAPVLDLKSEDFSRNKCFADSDCGSGRCVAGQCQSNKPLLKQWWFWTAVSVGAVGLGAGAYFLFQMQNRPMLEITTP